MNTLVRAVIVICFNPMESKVKNLINKVSGEGTVVYIANNGGMSVELIDSLKSEGVEVITFDENLGLGKAINEIAEIVPQTVRVIFTFDQDSSPPENYILRTWDHYVRLAERQEKLGVLTPSFVDARSGYQYQQKAIATGEEFTELTITLQSGMCIPIDVWRENKFNPELFIEFVDTEWCYRIKSKGYKVLQMNDVVMHHEVSDQAPKEFLGFKLLKYKPIRRYYFFRNAIFLLKQSYVPLYNKVRLLTGACNRILAIALLDDFKTASYKQSLFGILDGIKLGRK